jgi:hypothetical protein
MASEQADPWQIMKEAIAYITPIYMEWSTV